MSKNIMEIFAILIAAIWALYLFAEKDSPALAKSMNINGRVDIDPLDQINCRARFNVEIKNLGKSIFEVDSIRLSYWKFAYITFTTQPFFSIDDSLQKYPSRFTTFSKSLSGSYPPETGGIHETFNFIIKRDMDSMIVFDCVVYAHGKRYIFFNDPIPPTKTYDFRMHCEPTDDR